MEDQWSIYYFMKIKELIYLLFEVGKAPMQSGSGPEMQFILCFVREALDGNKQL